MRYKNSRIEREWINPLLDFRVRVIALVLDWYCKRNFGIDIQLTGIHRTKEEQDRIYKNSSGYKESPWTSVHQVWRGIDVGVNKFSEEERRKACNFINKYFDYSGRHNSCVYHDVGKGWHFHLQVDWKCKLTVYK